MGKIVTLFGTNNRQLCQTRKQELFEEELKELSEDEKRLKIRSQVRSGNYNLNNTASK